MRRAASSTAGGAQVAPAAPPSLLPLGSTLNAVGKRSRRTQTKVW